MSNMIKEIIKGVGVVIVGTYIIVCLSIPPALFMTWLTTGVCK
jgi:hypothetical protein